MSIADKFISIPDAKFFPRHTVMMNYGGKVYTILRGIELLDTNLKSDTWWLFFLYAVFMTLGLYWYTRFWLLPEDIDSYYQGQMHILYRISNIAITLGAAMYYVIFGVLFFLVYQRDVISSALSFSLWNFWCAANLLLATPLFGDV